MPSENDPARSHTTARIKLVEAITNPLGFFVLALLIVEAFLGTVLVGASLVPGDKMTCIYMGVGLFVLVVGMVMAAVWFKPQNLTFDKDAHLADRRNIPFGSNTETVSAKSLFTSSKKEEGPQ